MKKIFRAAEDVVLIPKTALKVWVKNRDERENWIKDLTKNYDDQKVGVLEVFPDKDDPGKFNTIIGNHRLSAALRRKDITELRCRVHWDITDEEAAELWRVEAKDRKNPTVPDLFWNKVVRGVPSAIEIKNLIESIGRIPARTKHSNAKNVCCFAALERCYDKSAPTVRYLFPVWKELFDGLSSEKK